MDFLRQGVKITPPDSLRQQQEQWAVIRFWYGIQPGSEKCVKKRRIPRVQGALVIRLIGQNGYTARYLQPFWDSWVVRDHKCQRLGRPGWTLEHQVAWAARMAGGKRGHVPQLKYMSEINAGRVCFGFRRRVAFVSGAGLQLHNP